MSQRLEKIVFVIDGDAAVRDATRMLLAAHGIAARTCASASEFLNDARLGEPIGCFILNAGLAGLNGIDLLDELHQRGIVAPAIITTSGTVSEFLYSSAARVGATLLEKPYAPKALIDHLKRALDGN